MTLHATAGNRRRRGHAWRAVVAALALGAIAASGSPASAAPAPAAPVSATHAKSSGFATAALVRKAGAPAASAISGPGPGCDAYIIGSSSVRQQQGVTVADVDAWGEFDCSSGLLYLSARSTIVDRTPGYDGIVRATGYQIVKSGAWGGGVDASDAFTTLSASQAGGRTVEGLLEMTMRLRGGYVWTSCTPPPTNRLLACDGLNTNTLHVIIGTNAFSTGL